MALFGRKNEQDTTLGKPPMGWGVPGVQKDESVDPEMEAMLLTAPAGQRRIGRAEIAEAISILTRYKQGKASLEERVVQDELWWELRHWEAIRKGKQRTDNPEYRGPEPSSAWLFNAILNKHADAMDNYPEPVVLPRERSDEESAKVLSSVLPVILEYNDYEQTYSDNWWEKLKHGTAAYGVFWNSAKENGLGDVDIREIDLLKLFWEPGVTDIQKSRNLFIVDLVDEDLLEQQYPEHKGHLSGGAVDVKQYIYDDTIDTSNKSVVVDWYYKTTSASGKTLLHYAKFVGETLLFASENDPNYRDTGWYDHGLYPVVLDVMFPEKGTPVGFGYVAICKDPQLYIDKLSSNILENSMMTTKKRFFVSDSTGINEEEFLDWSKPLVHVQGELDDRRIKEIATNPLDDIYVTVAQMKIEEMKDTAANRDVNSGSAGSGVTAAAAIAALQEAGNKASRGHDLRQLPHPRQNQFDVHRAYPAVLRRDPLVPHHGPDAWQLPVHRHEQRGHQGAGSGPDLRRPPPLPQTHLRPENQGPEEKPLLPHGAERAGQGAVRPGLLQPGAGAGGARCSGNDGV